MIDVLVGTAGHVDHGKTALLRALTGIDCDRLPEEKQRGITLDLGFAHLEQDDLALGFVDVPGHERFLHNALAGLGGIRILLLVVAADEGVRPQTREHLAIAGLLGIETAIVAVTKRDLVDAETAALVALEVAELLTTTPWRGAPILEVSSTSGEGIDALRAELLRRARALPPLGRETGPARLPIDRAFAPRGQGVVVTGTIARGTVRVGDELTLEPAGRFVRVRGLQIHGRPRDAASAGARAALQLAGADLAELGRGRELVGAGGPAPVRRLLARVRLLDDAPLEIAAALEVRLFLGASEVGARALPVRPERLGPGEEGLVELRAADPLVAARGDRLVVRRPSPAATLGGGVVLDPAWRPPPRAELEARLDALASDDERALAAWALGAGALGLSPLDAARRLGRGETDARERLEALAAAGRLVSGAGRWFHPARLAALEERAKGLLAERFAADRLAEAMPKAELVRRLLGRRATGEVVELHLGWLARRGVLELAGDRVAPPGRRAELTETESGLAGRIVALYESAALAPPSPGEAARRLAAKPEIVEGLVRHLCQRRRLVRLPAGLVFAAAALEQLGREVLETGWERFDVARFKERFGLSRKWAIPLLEHLDSVGVTRRAGDERIVARRAAPPAG